MEDLRIPNAQPNSFPPPVLTWPMDPTTQQVLRRWLDGQTSGITGGNIVTTNAFPGGVNKDVQYNDNNVFGGDSNFQWNKTGGDFGGRLSIVDNLDFPRSTGGRIKTSGEGPLTIDLGVGATETEGGSFKIECLAGSSPVATVTRSIGYTQTTDNAYHAVDSVVTLLNGNRKLIRARVLGYYTSGSGGTAGDCFFAEFISGARNQASTLSLRGPTNYIYLYTDSGTVDARFNVSGSNVLLQVKGDTNTVYAWAYELWSNTF